MGSQPRRHLLWKLLASRAALLVGIAGSVLLAMIAVPVSRDHALPVNPAASARAVQQSLQDRIRDWVPGFDLLVAAGNGEAPDLAALQRSLFAPAAADTAPVAATTEEPATAAQPRLAGILIDGPWRQAVFGSRVVVVGDSVAGQRVVAIEADRVCLERDGQTRELQVGDTP